MSEHVGQQRTHRLRRQLQEEMPQRGQDSCTLRVTTGDLWFQDTIAPLSAFITSTLL